MHISQVHMYCGLILCTMDIKDGMEIQEILLWIGILPRTLEITALAIVKISRNYLFRKALQQLKVHGLLIV